MRPLTVDTIIFVVALAILLAVTSAMANEEPAFEVLHRTDAYEIRQYDPYIVAEVDVEGDFKQAGNTAFQILAGYIFGNNRESRKMAMTVPVESAPTGSGTKMAMTAPVTSAPTGGEDQYTYAFVMESQYTMETLPVPNDSRIQIRVVEPRIVAVKRYSGFWTEGNYNRNERALLAVLQNDNVPIAGVPSLARYNGPFTPWFMRRNEVLVEIDWTSGRVARGSDQQNET